MKTKPYALLAALAAPFLAPDSVRAGLVVTPSPGFSVTWDGNDGDGFDPNSPAPVPSNLATGAGAAPLSSSDLGPELGIPHHVAANLTDGLYGNNKSWIGGNLPGGVPAPFAGVKLGGFFAVSGFAFGRDSGNNVSDDCGGQCTDRSLGIYKIQITRVATPSTATPDTGSAATGWQTIGTLDYQFSDDGILGGAFTSYFRHEYDIAAGGNPIVATGLRLIVPVTGLGGGTAIDEIEIFGTPGVDPDPDGDGFDTSVEIAVGTDPNNAASSPEGISSHEPAFAFHFYGSANNTYFIEATEDLLNWLPVEENIQGPGDKIRRSYSMRDPRRRLFRAKPTPIPADSPPQ